MTVFGEVAVAECSNALKKPEHFCLCCHM